MTGTVDWRADRRWRWRLEDAADRLRCWSLINGVYGRTRVSVTFGQPHAHWDHTADVDLKTMRVLSSRDELWVYAPARLENQMIQGMAPLPNHDPRVTQRLVDAHLAIYVLQGSRW